MIHYPVPPSLQHAYKYLGFKKGDFPIAETIANEMLSLPIGPHVNLDDIEVICNKIYNIEDDITNSDYVQLSNTPIIDGYIPSLLSYISNNIIKHDINATIVKYNGPDKEKNCGICWCDKNDQDFIKFNCSHETCNTCLNKIVGENNSTSCPFCRTKITKIQLNEGTKITFAIKTD